MGDSITRRRRPLNEARSEADRRRLEGDGVTISLSLVVLVVVAGLVAGLLLLGTLMLAGEPPPRRRRRKQVKPAERVGHHTIVVGEPFKSDDEVTAYLSDHSSRSTDSAAT